MQKNANLEMSLGIINVKKWFKNFRRPAAFYIAKKSDRQSIDEV